jgi:hypothetical protein
MPIPALPEVLIQQPLEPPLPRVPIQQAVEREARAKIPSPSPFLSFSVALSCRATAMIIRCISLIALHQM